MPFIIGYDEAKKNVRKRKSQLGYFVFDDQPEWPHAQLNGHEATGEQYFSAAHFHELDQFQVSVDGNFKIGRHELTPYCIHFTRAYTPYGPLVSDGGFAFMVMRAHHDKGKYTLSKGRELLQQVPGRQPWQVSQK